MSLRFHRILTLSRRTLRDGMVVMKTCVTYESWIGSNNLELSHDKLFPFILHY